MNLQDELLKVTDKHWKNSERIIKELKKEFDLTKHEIQKVIAEFYLKYDLNEAEQRYFEADKLLTNSEHRLYRERIEQSLRMLIGDNEKVENEYNQLINQKTITRKEAYQNEIKAFLILLGLKTDAIIEEHLIEVYGETYKKYSYLFHKEVGAGTPIEKLAQDLLAEKVHFPYSGNDFTDTIWKNVYTTDYNIRKVINNGLHRGLSYEQMAEDLSERINVSHSTARSIVRNETSFVVNEATAQSYEQSGTVQQYRIIATLDKRTTQICRDEDGEVYNLKDREQGINFPPYHWNCRTTTSPVVPDVDEIHSKRLAKHPESGKWYEIDSNITYRDWEKQFIK